jgi:CubicO group peptidase (beta-lactamase class C family)
MLLMTIAKARSLYARLTAALAAVAAVLLAWPTAAAPVTASAAPMTTADVDAWLDGYMPAAIAKADIAGAVVVVVKDGQILAKRGYGWADVAKKIPVDPDKTLFRPGSISKLFVWTAVLQQVELGKLDLDADVNTYLDFKIPPYRGKPITLRNIMTHAPGFEEKLRWLIGDSPAPALGAYLKDGIPDRIYAPGKIPAYSNYASGLAAYAVERVSGEPFETYVERHILGPLGMTQSTFRQPTPAKP